MLRFISRKRVLSVLIAANSFAFVLASAITSAQAQPGAAALRYQWKDGQTFAYQVTITAEQEEFDETLQGTIWYTVAAGQGEQLRLNFNGGLAKSRKNKAIRGQPGIPFGPQFGPPGFGPGGPFGRTTMGGLTQSNNEIVMTPRGAVQSLKGSSQLPYLMGNLSLLIIEPLPETAQRAWKIENGVSITEGGRAGGPPFFGSPFAPKPEEKTTAGSESTTFAVERDDATSLVASKTYKLVSPAADKNAESFEINGSGKWTFNRTLGISESLDFQQALTVRQGNTTTNIPMRIKYHRLSDAEIQTAQEESKKRMEEHQRIVEEQKRKAEAPLDAAERKELLADLGSENVSHLLRSLHKLQAKSPAQADEQIVAALRPLLQHKNASIKRLAGDALAKWSPADKATLELNRKFAGPGFTDPTNRPVGPNTKLAVGQILLAHNTGAWYPIEIRSLLPDGRVEAHFRGWGESHNKLVARAVLQLAPDELDQPNIKSDSAAVAASDNAPPSGDDTQWRQWSDDSGKFKIEAVFVSLIEGKVKLRRKDGKEVAVPLDRLARADRELAEKLAKEPTNPFE